jgi:excisionase family DNA binding protein
MSGDDHQTDHQRAEPIVRAARAFGEISEIATSERERLLLERPEIADELLTPEQVMAALRIKRTRYQDMIAAGELLSIKPGRERLVLASDLRRWIRENAARQP